MKKLQFYKDFLMKEANKSQSKGTALKMLHLLDYYQNKKRYDAVEYLLNILETYSQMQSDTNTLVINLPDSIEEKINILYRKRIQTFKFGTKTLESSLDSLINEVE